MPIDQLQNAFRRALGLAPDTDLAGLVYGGLDAWDSVGHMQLIAAIESAFGIMLDTADVIDLSSYGKAVEIVRRYGVAI